MANRRTSYNLFVQIIFALLLAIFSDARAVNLLSNPGFETGTTGWVTWMGSVNTATTAQKHSGSYSCLSSGRTQYWQGPVQSVLGKGLTPGVKYRVSGWVRMDNTSSDTLAITLATTDSAGTHYWTTPSTSVTNTAWSSIVGYYTMPSPAGTITALNLYCSEPTDTESRYNFYFDDVAVESPEDVAVDLSVDKGMVTYRASGFLHGLSDTHPSASVFEPLKPRLYRFDPALTGGWGPGLHNSAYIHRAKNAGARLQLILSDEYGYGYNPAGWPGDDGVADAALRQTLTDLHNVIVSRGYTGIEWDIWNEPDYGDPNPDNKYFWKASQAQFFKAWKVAYIKIRQLEPAAVIVGPSIAFFAPNGQQGKYLKEFLLYCKANHCLPDVLSWHEMNDYKAIPSQVMLMRQFMADNSIPEIPIDLNEYISETLTTKPGTYPWFYAALEQAGVKGAAHACWNDNTGENTATVGRLDGLASKINNLPLASWHIAKAYADMSGNIVSVTAGVSVAGVASLNPENGEVKILLGNDTTQSKSINVVINGLDELRYFIVAGAVRVMAQRISDNGWNEVSAPELVSDSIYQPTGGSLTLPFTFAANQAYIITLKYPCTLRSDLNYDCIVNFKDLMILTENWLE